MDVNRDVIPGLQVIYRQDMVEMTVGQEDGHGLKAQLFHLTDDIGCPICRVNEQGLFCFFIDCHVKVGLDLAQHHTVDF